MYWPLVGWLFDAAAVTDAAGRGGSSAASGAALRAAVAAGDALAVAAAVKGGADVNSEQLWPEGRGDGETAVHIAAAVGHAEVMATLLAVPGVDVNGLASEGWTPLCLASHAGHRSVVAQLLAAPGVDVNAQCTGGLTALHLATIGGSVEVAQLLLSAQDITCDVNVRTGGGETALHLAVLNDRESIVKLLLADGRSDVNARTADQGGGRESRPVLPTCTSALSVDLICICIWPDAWRTIVLVCLCDCGLVIRHRPSIRSANRSDRASEGPAGRP
jgi:ankyrin repeat protein